MTDNPIPEEPGEIKRISLDEMRKKFNEGGYWEKVKSGELTSHVLESRISLTLSQETLQIESQMISYRTKDGKEIDRVHQYLRSDGTIAASGKPDPKRLLENGTLYRLEKSKNKP